MPSIYLEQIWNTFHGNTMLFQIKVPSLQDNFEYIHCFSPKAWHSFNKAVDGFMRGTGLSEQWYFAIFIRQKKNERKKIFYHIMIHYLTFDILKARQ